MLPATGLTVLRRRTAPAALHLPQHLSTSHWECTTTTTCRSHLPLRYYSRAKKQQGSQVRSRRTSSPSTIWSQDRPSAQSSADDYPVRTDSSRGQTDRRQSRSDTRSLRPTHRHLPEEGQLRRLQHQHKSTLPSSGAPRISTADPIASHQNRFQLALQHAEEEYQQTLRQPADDSSSSSEVFGVPLDLSPEEQRGHKHSATTAQGQHEQYLQEFGERTAEDAEMQAMTQSYDAEDDTIERDLAAEDDSNIAYCLVQCIVDHCTGPATTAVLNHITSTVETHLDARLVQFHSEVLGSSYVMNLTLRIPDQLPLTVVQTQLKRHLVQHIAGADQQPASNTTPETISSASDKRVRSPLSVRVKYISTFQPNLPRNCAALTVNCYAPRNSHLLHALTSLLKAAQMHILYMDINTVKQPGNIHYSSIQSTVLMPRITNIAPNELQEQIQQFKRQYNAKMYVKIVDEPMDEHAATAEDAEDEHQDDEPDLQMDAAGLPLPIQITQDGFKSIHHGKSAHSRA